MDKVVETVQELIQTIHKKIGRSGKVLLADDPRRLLIGFQCVRVGRKPFTVGISIRNRDLLAREPRLMNPEGRRELAGVLQGLVPVDASPNGIAKMIAFEMIVSDLGHIPRGLTLENVLS